MEIRKKAKKRKSEKAKKQKSKKAKAGFDVCKAERGERKLGRLPCDRKSKRTEKIENSECLL